MKLKYLSFILLCGLALASCSRDREAPSIDITAPADNTAVAPGGSFVFQATVTDNEGLSTISIEGLSQTVNVSSAEFDDPLSHQLNYNVTINSDSDPGELILTVRATDLEDNSSTEEVTVLIQ